MVSLLVLMGVLGLALALPLGMSGDEGVELDDEDDGGEGSANDVELYGPTDSGLPDALWSGVEVSDSEMGDDAAAPASQSTTDDGLEASEALEPEFGQPPSEVLGSESDVEEGHNTAEIHPVLFGLNEVGWSGDGAETLRGSDEADFLEVQSDPVNVFSGPGADTIDASLAESAFIVAEEGDQVIGPDHTDNAFDVIIRASDGAVVEGGEGAAVFISVGSEGANITGGDGDDLLLSDDGPSTLRGGGGNDLLMATSEEFGDGGQWSAPPSDQSVDLLDGGSGDDTLSLSTDDIAIGGEGSDLFLINGPAATIEDFDPEVDTIEISINAQSLGASFDNLQDEEILDLVTVSESDGLTYVSFAGTVYATIASEGAVWVCVEDQGEVLEPAVSSSSTAATSEVTPSCKIVLQ